MKPTRIAILGLLFCSAASLKAVLFYSTDNPSYNTTAPKAGLSDSGWQFQGSWVGFLGTAIASNFFIAAKHVNGTAGQPLNLNGVSYTTRAFFDDPDSDLRLWQICGVFPAFAPLYTNSDEVGKSLVVFGRGTQRGAPVTSTNLSGTITNGWLWGPGDGVQRWGQNTVAAIANRDGVIAPGLGDLLQANFEANGETNECDLSSGDSSGGLFIQDGSVWKLAGINYGVDGPYNNTNVGTGFEAAIFDGRGLYDQPDTTWVLITESSPQPGAFYATRLSAHLNWINNILNGAADQDSPLVQSSANVDGPYTETPQAVVISGPKKITIARPARSQFFRLRSCSPVRITGVVIEGDNLLLTYE